MSLVTATYTLPTSEIVTRRAVECGLCGIGFEYTPRKTGGGRVPRFCGEECADKNYRLNVVTKEQRKIWRDQEKKPKAVRLSIAKTCKVCLNEFEAQPTRTVYPSICSKKCRSLNRRKYYLENKDWLRLKEIRARYGLEAEEYLGMLSAQGGLCKICHAQEKLVIDHDHKTGKVRGLLCSKCNYGLGSFMDETDFLSSAIKYLEDSRCHS